MLCVKYLSLVTSPEMGVNFSDGGGASAAGEEVTPRPHLRRGAAAGGSGGSGSETAKRRPPFGVGRCPRSFGGPRRPCEGASVAWRETDYSPTPSDISASGAGRSRAA